jgi:hypothetical protein
MEELRALMPIARILIAGLEINAQTQDARRVSLDDGGGIVGCRSGLMGFSLIGVLLS